MMFQAIGHIEIGRNCSAKSARCSAFSGASREFDSPDGATQQRRGARSRAYRRAGLRSRHAARRRPAGRRFTSCPIRSTQDASGRRPRRAASVGCARCRRPHRHAQGRDLCPVGDAQLNRPDIKLTLVGPGRRHGLARTLQRAFRVVPGVPYADMPARSRRRRLRLPLPARGLAMVVTRRSRRPAVDRHAELGQHRARRVEGFVVPIRNADAIAQRLAQLADDRQRGNAWARRAGARRGARLCGLQCRLLWPDDRILRPQSCRCSDRVSVIAGGAARPSISAGQSADGHSVPDRRSVPPQRPGLA